MKTSDLKKIKGGILPFRVLSNITCDEMMASPPEGLLWAGFRLEYEAESKEIQEDLIDTLVAWGVLGNHAKNKGAKIEPVLELEFKGDWSVDDVAFWATGGDFNVALIGLHDNSPPEDVEQYIARYKELNKKLLNTNNFKKYSFPFFMDLELAMMRATGQEIAANDIMKKNQQALIDIKKTSDAKREYALRYTPLGHSKVYEASQEIIADFFGDDATFKKIAISLMKPIIEKMNHFEDEQKDKPKTKTERFGV